MASLLRRNTLFYTQLRHRSTDGSSVPTFNMNTEKKAFLEVLPEVIHSVVTSPTLAEMPEVGSWMKKLMEYTLGEGKLGRGLMASVGYRMFEEPDNFSEETQHAARVLGWCTEMLQETFVILDDIADRGTIRRGKMCWYLQPNVGLSGIKDALLLYQSTLDVLDIYFGRTPIYGDLLKYFNEDDYMDVYVNDSVTGKTGRDIEEGKCTWVAVTALKHCNDAQRAIFKEYYGSDDPEHVKRIKQLYDELHLPQLYEQRERAMYDELMCQIHALPSEGDRNFLLEILNATYKRVY